jgi:hypothetical protein
MSLPPAAEYACSGDHCITCSDEGVAMRVLWLEGGGDGLAVCADEHGTTYTVETTLLEGVAPGSRVLVHADVAIASLAEDLR